MGRRQPVAAAARATLVALALASGAAAGDDLRPLPTRAPSLPAVDGLRVHLISDEELEPDLLRALARPGVVLWLRTHSNTLRESTLDTVRQFDSAWVELRPPLTDAALRQFSRLPQAGIWLRLDGERAPPPAVRPGPVRLAITWTGPLGAEQAAALTRLSPALVDWKGGAQIDLLSWSLFKNLPGKKLLRPEPDALSTAGCAPPAGQGAAVAVHVASLLAVGTDPFPCGKGPRVRVALDTEPWVLQSVHVKDPSAELELEVGSEATHVTRARKLFDAIGLLPRRIH